MAYIFDETELPRLVSTVPGRERTFFVNKDLTKIDDMLAGIMHYAKNASSPYHFHKNCEHFYFIFEGNGTVDTPEGSRDVGPGDLLQVPAQRVVDREHHAHVELVLHGVLRIREFGT